MIIPNTQIQGIKNVADLITVLEGIPSDVQISLGDHDEESYGYQTLEHIFLFRPFHNSPSNEWRLCLSFSYK